MVMEFVVNVDSVDEREAWHAAVADSPIADFLVFAPDLHEVSPRPRFSTQTEPLLWRWCGPGANRGVLISPPGDAVG